LGRFRRRYSCVGGITRATGSAQLNINCLLVSSFVTSFLSTLALTQELFL
jgi:hypothetical protein